MQGSFGQYATLAGAPVHGLRLLRDAAGRLPRSAPPTARAWLAALEAVALGYLGDRAALKVLDDAQRYADAGARSEPVWPWVFPFDSSKVASYRAVAASRLGLAHIAVHAFDQAAAARSPKHAAPVAAAHPPPPAPRGHTDQAPPFAVAPH